MHVYRHIQYIHSLSNISAISIGYVLINLLLGEHTMEIEKYVVVIAEVDF